MVQQVVRQGNPNLLIEAWASDDAPALSIADAVSEVHAFLVSQRLTKGSQTTPRRHGLLKRGELPVWQISARILNFMGAFVEQLLQLNEA